jgi:hypothetical protein
MQHLDEGTIHSWLDGELDSDEAARVEAHVKECPECAAAVAEARGFIAASSRILTALDNAPRGVIPAAAPKKRLDPLVWRVAATLLVVAAGTLVVVRNVGNNSSEQFTLIESADTAPVPSPAPPIITQANPTRISSDNSQPSVASGEQSATRARASAPSITLSKKVDLDQRANNNELEGRTLTGKAAGSIGRQDAAGYSGAVAPSAPQALRVAPSLAVGTAMDAAREEPERLKVVGTPRAVGVKITLYEVAPGDTVTLTEPIAALLSSVVTGAASGAPLRAAREKTAAPTAATRTEAVTAATLDAQSARAAQSSAAPTQTPSAPPPVRQAEIVNGVTTISWTDATTGNVLKLSGRMPEARLQQIRVRIERERAAAAKKTP